MVKRAILFQLFLLFLWAGMAVAQPLTFQQVLIEGNQRVERSAIEAVIQVRAGRPVSMEEIDQDIRNIYQLGRFQDVEAAEDRIDGTRILIYRVHERPLLREVRFEGQRKLKKDKLSELAAIRVPELYDPKNVDRAVTAMRRAYRDEGYHGARIEPEIDINEHNEATLTFVIEEGRKVRVDQISFSGNSALSDRELRKAIETRERWFLSWLTGRGTFNEELLNHDLELIAEEYFNRGYVQVRIKDPVITFSDDMRTLSILFEIEEGEQYFIGDIDIQGDLLKDKEELLALVQLQTGDVFSRARLREDVFRLNDLYADSGYAYVNVSPLTRLDNQERLVHLMFDVEQGIQVYIDRIHITGNTKTRDKVIRREMRLNEGELFNATRLKESRRRINNLGFFDEVNVATARGDEPELMVVEVDVTERPTGSFSIGAGYSSVDGMLFQGALQQDNFLGRGLRMDLSAALGGRSTTYRFGMTDPYFLDKDLTLGFDLYRTDREWPSFSEKRTGGNLKLGVPLSDDVRAFFLYRLEEKDIYDVAPTASRFVREQMGTSTLSSLTSLVRRDTTDYRLDPTRGAVSEASVEFAGLGGDQQFLKYIASHRHYFPFKWDTYFSAHGQVGYVHGWGGKDVPIEERFFLGGINSLRGFKSRRVGPRDGDDFIGGEKSAYGNLEYIFPLVRDVGLKGVVFFDAGNTWRENEDYFSDIRYNTGAGIRWFSPLGPLRLEWGYNLNPRDDEERTEWQFSIGRFF
ncbi:outer membrane protein assembly factor BamA [Geoalkalibacter halelectricus]|uniref:Outer membrane protein assembly factor BamA n=1 Tax=Geoalkalibacter halelectricus TaxID=2847045 RepID=A0ABY5ZG61_9BACT|nr:outer membrane protein assembly factor BamA [Geoalkalibacter halelectricus]MDO3379560.1 outer membrane protein assembly factor BamA [Geoalkalibacter halelectricus]UWZ78148.1 outer membrane protein assembly factor BamA [Geoalkalibacter halelectricus]